jgi:hypothetical protein
VENCYEIIVHSRKFEYICLVMQKNFAKLSKIFPIRDNPTSSSSGGGASGADLARARR